MLSSQCNHLYAIKCLLTCFLLTLTPFTAPSLPTPMCIVHSCPAFTKAHTLRRSSDEVRSSTESTATNELRSSSWRGSCESMVYVFDSETHPLAWEVRKEEVKRSTRDWVIANDGVCQLHADTHTAHVYLVIHIVRFKHCCTSPSHGFTLVTLTV